MKRDTHKLKHKVIGASDAPRVPADILATDRLSTFAARFKVWLAEQTVGLIRRSRSGHTAKDVMDQKIDRRPYIFKPDYSLMMRMVVQSLRFQGQTTREKVASILGYLPLNGMDAKKAKYEAFMKTGQVNLKENDPLYKQLTDLLLNEKLEIENSVLLEQLSEMKDSIDDPGLIDAKNKEMRIRHYNEAINGLAVMMNPEVQTNMGAVAFAADKGGIDGIDANRSAAIWNALEENGFISWDNDHGSFVLTAKAKADKDEFVALMNSMEVGDKAEIIRARLLENSAAIKEAAVLDVLSNEGKHLYRYIMLALMDEMSPLARVDMIEAAEYFSPLMGFQGDDRHPVNLMRKIALTKPPTDDKGMASFFETLRSFNKKGKVAEITKRIFVKGGDFYTRPAEESHLKVRNSIVRHAETKGLKPSNAAVDFVPLHDQDYESASRLSSLAQEASAAGLTIYSESHAGLASRFAAKNGGKYKNKAVVEVGNKKLIHRLNQVQIGREIARIVKANPNDGKEALKAKVLDFFRNTYKKELILNPYNAAETMLALVEDKAYEVFGEKMSFFDLVGYENPNVLVGFTYLIDPLKWTLQSDIRGFNLTAAEQLALNTTSGVKIERDGKAYEIVAMDDGKFCVGKVTYHPNRVAAAQVTHTGHGILQVLRTTKLDANSAKDGVILFTMNGKKPDLIAWLKKIQSQITYESRLSKVKDVWFSEVEDQFDTGQTESTKAPVKIQCQNETQESYWLRRAANVKESTSEDSVAKINEVREKGVYTYFSPTEGLIPWLEGGSNKYWLRMGYVMSQKAPVAQLMVLPMAGLGNMGSAMMFTDGLENLSYAPEGAEIADARSTAMLAVNRMFNEGPFSKGINANELMIRHGARSEKTKVRPGLIHFFGSIKGDPDEAYMTDEFTQLQNLMFLTGNQADDGGVLRLVDDPDVRLTSLKAYKDMAKAERCAVVQDGYDLREGTFAVNHQPNAAAGFHSANGIGALNMAPAVRVAAGSIYVPPLEIPELVAGEEVKSASIAVSVDEVSAENLDAIASYLTLAKQDSKVKKIMFAVPTQQDLDKVKTFLQDKGILKASSAATMGAWTLGTDLFLETLPVAPKHDPQNGDALLDQSQIQSQLIDKLSQKALAKIPAEKREEVEAQIQKFFGQVVRGKKSAVAVAQGISDVYELINLIAKGKILPGMDEGNFAAINQGESRVWDNFNSLLEWLDKMKNDCNLEGHEALPTTGKIGFTIQVRRNRELGALQEYHQSTQSVTDNSQFTQADAEKRKAMVSSLQEFEIEFEDDMGTAVDDLKALIELRIEQSLIDRFANGYRNTKEGKALIKAFRDGEWDWGIAAITEESSNKLTTRDIPVKSFIDNYQPFDHVSRSRLLGKFREIWGVHYTGKVLGAYFDTENGHNFISLLKMKDADIKLLRMLINEEGVAALAQAQKGRKGYFETAPIKGDSRGALMAPASTGRSNLAELADGVDVVVNTNLAEGFNSAAIETMVKPSGTQAYVAQVRPIAEDEVFADHQLLRVFISVNENKAQPVFVRYGQLKTHYSDEKIRALCDGVLVADYMTADTAELLLGLMGRGDNGFLGANYYSYWGDLGYTADGLPVRVESMPRAFSNEALNMPGNDRMQTIVVSSGAGANVNAVLASSPETISTGFDQTFMIMSGLQGKSVHASTMGGGAYQVQAKAFADANEGTAVLKNNSGRIQASFVASSAKDTSVDVAADNNLIDLNQVSLDNQDGQDYPLLSQPLDGKINGLSISAIRFNDASIEPTEVAKLFKNIIIGGHELKNGIAGYEIVEIIINKKSRNRNSKTAELVLKKTAKPAAPRPLELSSYAGQQKAIEILVDMMVGNPVKASASDMTDIVSGKVALDSVLLDRLISILEDVVGANPASASHPKLKQFFQMNKAGKIENLELLFSFIGNQLSLLGSSNKVTKYLDVLNIVNATEDFKSRISDADAIALAEMLLMENDLGDTDTTFQFYKNLLRFYTELADAPRQSLEVPKAITKLQQRIPALNLGDVEVNRWNRALNTARSKWPKYVDETPRIILGGTGRTAMRKAEAATAEYFGTRLSAKAIFSEVNPIVGLGDRIGRNTNAKPARDVAALREILGLLLLKNMGFSTPDITLHPNGVTIERPGQGTKMMEYVDGSNAAVVRTGVDESGKQFNGNWKSFLQNANQEQLGLVFDENGVRQIITWRENAILLGKNPSDFSDFEVQSGDDGKPTVFIRNISGLWQHPSFKGDDLANKFYSPDVLVAKNGEAMNGGDAVVTATLKDFKQLMTAKNLQEVGVGQGLTEIGRAFYLLRRTVGGE